MSSYSRFANPRVDTIRALNDAFRENLVGGSVMFTQAVAALGPAVQNEIIAAVRSYDDFDADNDPYGEHDFGLIKVEGREIIFKIDYYDLALTMHSPDAADPSLTHRVLTIMLAEDY